MVRGGSVDRQNAVVIGFGFKTEGRREGILPPYFSPVYSALTFGAPSVTKKWLGHSTNIVGSSFFFFRPVRSFATNVRHLLRRTSPMVKM